MVKRLFLPYPVVERESIRDDPIGVEKYVMPLLCNQLWSTVPVSVARYLREFLLPRPTYDPPYMSTC